MSPFYDPSVGRVSAAWLPFWAVDAMAMGHAHAQPLAPPTAAPAASHSGRCPCVIDEDETFEVEIELAVEPVLPALQDVRPILLCRVRSLFFPRDPVPVEEPPQRSNSKAVTTCGELCLQFD